MEKDGAYKEGTLKISEEVISTITKIAVSDIKGVEEIVPINDSGISIVSSIKSRGKPTEWLNPKKILGKKNNLIKVKLLGDVVEITISFIASYGCKVTSVAESIQESVKSSVQSMTGITVSRVNVIAAGISINKDKQN